jgi:SAM-dependent methyltransferase
VQLSADTRHAQATTASAELRDVGYTAGFFREMAPTHLAFAALLCGHSPGANLQPQRMMELGFGQGFGLALLAAANPDIVFEGCDFNPEHVRHAQKLIADARLANISMRHASFEHEARRGGDQDIDVIALHGVLSWVSRETQNAIVAIVRNRLRPGGLLYVSYNCLPGWAPIAPIRQLIRDFAVRVPGDVQTKLAASLDLLKALKDRNAFYFKLNPVAARHLDAMLSRDARYLVHEYMEENWAPLPFSDVVTLFNSAGLSYLTSATLSENLDQCAVPPGVLPVLAQTEDPVLKESLRDLSANKFFRRDIFIRGEPVPPDATELAALPLVLAVPRDRVSLDFAGPLATLTGKTELYAPILDMLADGITTFGRISELPVFAGKRTLLLECLCLLVHSGQVLPKLELKQADPAPAQRLNRVIADRAKRGQIYESLASPVTRTGLPVSDFGLLALGSLYDGITEAAVAAERGLEVVAALGRRPTQDGKAVAADGEAIAVLEQHMRPVFAEFLPVWRQLGII